MLAERKRKVGRVVTVKRDRAERRKRGSRSQKRGERGERVRVVTGKGDKRERKKCERRDRAAKEREISVSRKKRVAKEERDTKPKVRWKKRGRGGKWCEEAERKDRVAKSEGQASEKRG